MSSDTCKPGDRLTPYETWARREDYRLDDARGCTAMRGIACCTRERDHNGQHVATCYGGMVVGTWP